MRKRWLSLCLGLILCLSFCVVPAAAASDVIVPFGKYDSISSFSEGFAQVGIGNQGEWHFEGKCGYIDVNGKEIVPCKYDYTLPFYGGYAVVGIGEYWDEIFFGGKVGLIDTTGKEIVPCIKYNSIGHFSEGLATVVVKEGRYVDGMYGFIDTTGREIVPCKYSSASSFSEGRAAVMNQNGKWGFIDKTGKEVIPCKYDSVADFHNGLAAVQVHNASGSILYGFINAAGQEVIPCQYYDYDYYGFTGTLAAVQNKEGKWGFIDKSGKEVIPFQYSDADGFSEGCAAVRDENGNWGVIDNTGKMLVPFKYDYHISSYTEGLAITVMGDGFDNSYGLIDSNGNELVPCKYYQMRNFSDGLAAVAVGGYLNSKCGFIDTTGKEVIPCQYASVGNFSNGFAAAEDLNGKWGIIDKTGKEVVPFQYKDVTGFPEREVYKNRAVVQREDGKWGVISFDNIPTVGGFSDVRADTYYADAVLWAVENRITSGTSSTTFSPDTTCTTGEILTFLWRANGSPAPASSNNAIPAGKYYTDAANWALEKGLTDSFDADTPATRAATVTYLWKLAGKPAAKNAASFTDVAAGAAYADAVAWAVEQGITGGTGANRFSPDVTCTRGQIVTFLYRDLAE